MKTPPERALTRDELARVDQTARMKIGEVADRLGLSLRSIRYYEETGLVTPSSRTAGGFRLYSEADVQRLLLIMQMKPLEFSLDEMREVLAALDALHEPGSDPETVRSARARLHDVADEVEERWRSLQQRLAIADSFRGHLAQELGEPAEG